VLDNCEHLITACASLAHELLSQCPHLKILATSREALALTGEHIFPVPTLAVPRQAPLSLADLLMQFEGIRLFVERARAVQPNFTLTEQSALIVSRICVRLDGIPLALELAATRVRTLSVEDIAGRLDDRFNLLTLGSRAAPPRHQTLRAVLDWSYDLLSEPERVLFRRLSVFAGGFTLDTLELVCADEGEKDPPGNSLLPSLLLDLLSRLVDKSLVMVEHRPGRVRYQMLETIREYAREKLHGSNEANMLRDRHLDVFVELAERAEIKLRGSEQGQWLEYLDMEVDNLRAALEWSLAQNVQKGLSLAGALAWFWNLRGYWHEGPAWLSQLFAISGASAPTVARAKALAAAGNLACWGNNDYLLARVWLEESIAIYRQLSPPDLWGLGYALSLYGEVLCQIEEFTLAQSALEESVVIGEDLDEAGNWFYAWALMSLGSLADTPTLAHVRLERSAALFRELGDKAQFQVVLAHLAWFYIGQKDYSLARTCAGECLTLAEQIGDKMGVAWSLKLLGDLALAQADYVQAVSHYQAGLDRFKTLGSKSGIAETLANLGKVRFAESDDVGARAFWQEALILFEEIGQKDAGARLLRKLEELDVSPSDWPGS
jgi:non-specific serine/threonine protein kinase